MDPETTVARVVDAGILAPTLEGDSFTIDSGLREDIEARHEELESLAESDIESRVEHVADDEADASALRDVCRANLDMLAALEVLDNETDLTPETRLDVLPAVDQFLRDPPREDGTPDGFVSTHADLLPLHITRANRAIVFIWREHCPSCRIMREEFETIFETPPEDITLLSVYGPAFAGFLLDQYDVQGGPTTLFTANGAVESRLLGAQHREVIEQEISHLRAA